MLIVIFIMWTSRSGTCKWEQNIFFNSPQKQKYIEKNIDNNENVTTFNILFYVL